MNTDQQFEISIYTTDEPTERFASVRHFASNCGADFYESGEELEWQDNNGLFSNCEEDVVAAARTAAEKALNPMKTNRKFYALHWSAGYGTTYANGGSDAVEVRSYDSIAERDAACLAYTAPNHCPTAALEAVPADNINVRRWKREYAKA